MPSAEMNDSHRPIFRSLPSRTKVSVIDEATVPASSRTSPVLSENNGLPSAFAPATAIASNAISARRKSTTSNTFHALAPANQWKNMNTSKPTPEAAAIVSPVLIRPGSKSISAAGDPTRYPLVDLTEHGRR